MAASWILYCRECSITFFFLNHDKKTNTNVAILNKRGTKSANLLVTS